MISATAEVTLLTSAQARHQSLLIAQGRVSSQCMALMLEAQRFTEACCLNAKPLLLGGKTHEQQTVRLLGVQLQVHMRMQVGYQNIYPKLLR